MIDNNACQGEVPWQAFYDEIIQAKVQGFFLSAGE